MESQLGRDYPPPITHPEHFYGFVGVAVAWQIAFLILAGDPVRYRLMIIPSILEKVSFGVAVVILYVQQRLATLVLGFGLVDLVWAALFVAAYVKVSSAVHKRAAA
jgi:hypothetical protein